MFSVILEWDLLPSLSTRFRTSTAGKVESLGHAQSSSDGAAGTDLGCRDRLGLEKEEGLFLPSHNDEEAFGGVQIEKPLVKVLGSTARLAATDRRTEC